MGKEYIYLNKLPIGTILSLNFEVKGNKFEFPIKIEHIIGKSVLFSVVRIDGKVLNLQKAEHLSVIYNQENKRPLHWNNLVLETYKHTDNKLYYIVNTQIAGTLINRRNAFRVYLGTTCDVQLGIHTIVKTATIKDLSFSGFSIIVENMDNIEDMLEKQIKITFDDTFFNYHITLQGQIKRIVKSENGDILLGCQLIKEYKNLDSYINLKQRDILTKVSSKNISKTAYKIKTIIK